MAVGRRPVTGRLCTIAHTFVLVEALDNALTIPGDGPQS
jgi:hypothetical protein